MESVDEPVGSEAPESNYEDEIYSLDDEHDEGGDGSGSPSNNQQEEDGGASGASAQEEEIESYKRELRLQKERFAAIQSQLVDMTKQKNKEIAVLSEQVKDLKDQLATASAAAAAAPETSAAASSAKPSDEENLQREEEYNRMADEVNAVREVVTDRLSKYEDPAAFDDALPELTKAAFSIVAEREGARKSRRRYEDQGTADDMKALRMRATHLASRHRQEKEAKYRAEDALRSSNKKVAALSDHIEKLMLHLKHEAASKAKAFELQRRAQRETTLLRKRNQALVKRNTARERVILEMQEGSKILEDQLRLMDEKYLELRVKLDWTRNKATQEVKKFKAEASNLRARFALLHPGEGLLDDARVQQDTLQLAMSMGLGQTWGGGPQIDSPGFGLQTSQGHRSKSAGVAATGEGGGKDSPMRTSKSKKGRKTKKRGLKSSQSGVSLGGGLPFTIKDFVTNPENADAPWSDEKVASLTRDLGKRRDGHR